MRLGGRLLLLVVLLCSSLGCAAPNRGNSTQHSSSIFPGNRCLNITEILPDEWQYINTYRLDTNGDGNYEWVVLYRFDQLNEQGGSNSPITAVIYQLDGHRPPSIQAYSLQPPDRDYLCECVCTPNMENVLSALDGPELVFRDQCGDQIYRLTIFYWDKDKTTYIPRGHFCGTCIDVTVDQVSVRERKEDRIQLSECKTYHAFQNATYYRPDDNGALVEHVQKEIVFSKEEPEDIEYSPYPEKIVLAFYHHYNDDEEASRYFAAKARDHLGQCDAGDCGCFAKRHEIERVRVLELKADPKDTLHPDQAIVRALINCKPWNGRPEGERWIQWRLIWEDERWQLERPE